MRRILLAAALCCTTTTAIAIPDCDGGVARGYTLQANGAGATCHSFVTRFGPSRYDTDECYDMDRYVARALREFEALKARGCVQMKNGPTRGEIAYARWLGREFDKLRNATWSDERGWVYE